MINRRVFLFFSSLVAGCKRSAPKPSNSTVVLLGPELTIPKSVDDDPWSQPRTRMYDKDLIEYCRRDVEATMALHKLHNPDLDESHREIRIIRTELEANALREAHAQARRDGYRDIGGGVWERYVRH